MRKSLPLVIVMSVFASGATAADGGYDANEAFSPEMIAKIKDVFENDFGSDGTASSSRVVAVNETWLDDHWPLVKAAFAEGS